MISDKDVLSVGLFMVSVLLLIPLYRNYRKFKIEQFRHKVFCLRSLLLCSVSDMGISLDDKNYVELRREMNLLIKHAGQFDAWAFLSSFFELKRSSSTGSDVFSSLDNVQNEEYRNLLEKINGQLARTFIFYALWSFLTACGIFFLYRLTSSTYNRVVKKRKGRTDTSSNNSVIRPVFQRAWAASSFFLPFISSQVDNHIK